MKFIDGHCDTITTAMRENKKLDKNNLHIDFQRLEKAGCICQFFAVWLEKQLYPRAFYNTKKAVDFFNSQIKDTSIKKVRSFGEINENMKNDCISAVLTVEGGEALEGSTEKLDLLYEMGIRLITLCWNYENELGFGAATGSNEGLKSFGIEAVKKMNELGIIIDVSHLNEKGFWDVFEKSEMPFAATHSNAYEICSHFRNLKDNQLEAVSQAGGVVGLNLYPDFLSNSSDAGIDDILRHTEHILNRAGERSVVLGFDFDGIDCMPKGISGIQSINLIYDKFINEFGEEIADSIFYKNYLNFLKSYLR